MIYLAIGVDGQWQMSFIFLFVYKLEIISSLILCLIHKYVYFYLYNLCAMEQKRLSRFL